jgi:hypothetical protein
VKRIDGTTWKIDDRIAADLLAALDRLEKKAVGAPVGELEHGRDRRLQIGDERRPHQHRPAVVLRAPELLDAGRYLHQSCRSTLA